MISGKKKKVLTGVQILLVAAIIVTGAVEISLLKNKMKKPENAKAAVTLEDVKRVKYAGNAADGEITYTGDDIEMDKTTVTREAEETDGAE